MSKRKIEVKLGMAGIFKIIATYEGDYKFDTNDGELSVYLMIPGPDIYPEPRPEIVARFAKGAWSCVDITETKREEA